ncbi:hypothetical protein PQR67_30475 [Paraburkholderia fungorum]|uniref:hypothetical protein n=1 Tax=Paraburkholderia fungorum TaxID=134537 RepID=UPI0038B74855
MLHRKPGTSAAFWQGRSALFARTGRKFHGVSAAGSDAMKRTPHSSSMVENLNSRVRICVTNRRHLNGGQVWLGLLQFVLNHRRFVRSRYAERTGRSPRELMSGQSHEHWLALLRLAPLQPLQA